MAKTFKTQFALRFHEADPAGIMFFGNIFPLAHNAFEEFIQEAGFAWQEWFSASEYIIPIRHAEADYLKPLVAGHEYTISVQVKAFGRSSFTMHYSFIQGSEVHAHVQMVHVVLGAKDKTPQPIPEKIRDRLSRYLEPSNA